MTGALVFLLMLAARVTAASTVPASAEVERAWETCNQGHYGEAIRQLDRLLRQGPPKDTADEADEFLDRCLRLVQGSEQAEALLRDIAEDYEGRPAGLKALALQAQGELTALERCSPPSPLYQQLMHRFGGTREAARVINSRAYRCLDSAGHEEEGLSDLERVAREQAGRPEGAYALWSLGTHYRSHEQRDRAAVYFKKLIAEYPESMEVPFHPGLKVVAWAKTDLEWLHMYAFSPLLDRFMNWLDRDLLRARLGVEGFKSVEFAILLVPYITMVGALAIVVLLVPFLRRRDGSVVDFPGVLFVHPWPVWRAVGFLLGFETARLIVKLMIAYGEDLAPSRFMIALSVYPVADTVLSGAVLFLALRGESIARVFAVDRRRLIRLVASILGGIVAGVVLVAIFINGLRWLGFLPSGPDPNRYFSEDLYLPFESWIWRTPLLLLWASAEEVLYRGVLHEALRRAMPVIPAAVLGSFVFAVWHARPLASSTGVFALGLVYVWLREKFRSLTPSSFCHFLWNALVVLLRGA